MQPVLYTRQPPTKKSIDNAKKNIDATQLLPMRSFSWLTPVLFLGVASLITISIVWIVQKNIRSNKQELIAQQVESLSEQIRLHLDANEAYLHLLATDRADGSMTAELFQKRASQYVAEHPEMIAIAWVDSTYLVTDIAPRAPNTQVIGLHIDLPEPYRASRLATTTKKPVYTDPFIVVQGQLSFEVWVPVYQKDTFLGLFTGVYSYNTLLSKLTTPQISKIGAISITNTAGDILYKAPTQNTIDETIVYRTRLLSRENESFLQIHGYGSDVQTKNILFLAILCALLTSGTLFITLRLRKEMRRTRESEQKFKTLFDNASDGVVLADSVTRTFTLVNATFAHMLGYSAQELVAMTVADIHPKKDLPSVLEKFEKQIKGELVIAGNIPVRRKNGTIFYADINASLIILNKQTYLLGIFRDITERKKAEDAIIERTAELKESQRIAGMGSWNWNALTDEIFWSEEYRRLIRYPLEQKPPDYKTHLSYYSAESATMLDKAVQLAMTKGTPYELELHLTHPEHGPRWIIARAEPTRDDTGGIIGLHGTAIDITKRKELEEALQQKTREQLAIAARYEALLGSMGDAVFAINAGSTLTYMNAAAERLFQHPYTTVAGKHFYDIWGLEDKTQRRIPPEDYLSSIALRTKKRIASSAYTVICPDGQKLPVTITASPIIIDSTVVGVVTIMKDFSNEARINQAKDEFISLASHQLRTPLSIIKWYAEALRSGSQKIANKKQQTYIKEIADSNERLIDLVNALLHISRIEQGRFIATPQETDVSLVVKTILKNLNVLITQKDLSLHTDLTHAEKVWIDQRILDIILQNLLSNAVLYTPKKGEIGITLQTKNKELLIEVWDTGIGIPKEAQEHLFEKFYRAPNAKNTQPSGTGLGLYIAKTFLSVLRGTIRFTSEEGKGTRFIVEIPLQKGTNTKTSAKKRKVA